ncbi:MAG TPA: hypothetical protein VFL42_10665 [Terriglobales bacterium]|nr:hypothetical protein [Terriglobales bacterium]
MQRLSFYVAGIAAAILVAAAFAIPQLAAQGGDPQMQQKIADLKVAAAQNKQAMTQYTWVQQETVALKGEVKKQEVFQVRIGPDGKPQKTPMDAGAQPQSGKEHGIRGHIKEHKLGELEDYAKSLGALAQQYATPEPGRLQEAAQSGNVLTGPAALPGATQLVISNYLKPGDKVTFVFDRQQHMLLNIQVNSYLQDPKDKASINIEFAQVPNGPTHASVITVNGESKQLTITMKNSDYQKI